MRSKGEESMKGYWGLRAICDRMGWRSLRTPIRQWEDFGFFMFKIRKDLHPRLYWYTNDQLINTWQISRVGVERKRMLAERKRRRGQE